MIDRWRSWHSSDVAVFRGLFGLFVLASALACGPGEVAESGTTSDASEGSGTAGNGESTETGTDTGTEPCEDVNLFESPECLAEVSERCRALSSQGACQSTAPFQVGDWEVFCQWTLVATLNDPATCSFDAPFGRCEAGLCAGFCDGAQADACGPQGQFELDNAFVFVDTQEFVDTLGNAAGRQSTPLGPWSAIEPTSEAPPTAWCIDGAQPPGPDWCGCNQQACAAMWP